jgi:hypothetical protein
MTDQEFDQLFDNGESILETLDISTAHRINCPTDLMTNQHPITPPPELFAQCYEEAERNLQVPFSLKFTMSHAIRTAYAAGYAAGADQEREALDG